MFARDLPAIPCGEACDACAEGLPAQCVHRTGSVRRARLTELQAGAVNVPPWLGKRAAGTETVSFQASASSAKREERDNA
jgi:hypothetical protein